MTATPPSDRSAASPSYFENTGIEIEAPPVRICQADVAAEKGAAPAAEREGDECEDFENRVEVVDERGLVLRVIHFVGALFEWIFGLFALVVGLAVLASVPVLQFFSLGYLLEASGRVTRTGKLRNGFIGVRQAARLGGAIGCAWLFLLPVRFVADLERSAELIDPSGASAAGWRAALALLTALVAVHIVWAWLRGGKIRHFLWPAPWLLVKSLGDLANGRVLSQASEAAWDFVEKANLPHFFWLGLRGFAGAVAWLFLPILCMALAPKIPNPGLGVLLGLGGSLMFAVVILYLPFLQARFAARNELIAMFQWAQVRQQFARAPLAFWFALLITLLFALPLYLLKIELTPREITWLPSLFFVAFIFPARLITGWALSRAERRDAPRLFLFRWMARLAAVPVAAFFALVVYFTQYFTWGGGFSLFEQHAFLVPAPFFGG